VCVPDLVIIKYFGNNTVEIKRIVFTYPVIYYHPLHISINSGVFLFIAVN